MRIAESGRFSHAAEAVVPRKYAERNLLALHGRAARLRAIFRGARLRSSERSVEAMDETFRLASAHPAASGADWLLVRDYAENSRGRSILFFFRDGDEVPRAVVKVRPVDASGQSLAREADVLRSLSPQVSDAIRRTLPRVDDLVRTPTHEMLVLSGVPGTPLSISMQRSLRPRSSHAPHLASAGRWIGTLHDETRDGDAVTVHGDLWPRNILFDRNAISGVVDWEHGSLRGEPWSDLFTLPLLYAIAAPSWCRRERLAAFRAGFMTESPLSEAVKRYFEAYLERAGGSREWLREAFDRWLDHQTGKEGTGWHSMWPWRAMSEAIRSANRSVFSG